MKYKIKSDRRKLRTMRGSCNRIRLLFHNNLKSFMISLCHIEPMQPEINIRKTKTINTCSCQW